MRGLHIKWIRSAAKLIPLLALGWLVIVPPTPVRGATAAEVDAALKKAKAFLYSTMKNANWETAEKRDPAAAKYMTTGGQWGGPTAVAVYALLASGEDPLDRKLAPSIAWLKTADIIGTYALSMRCQVWFMLPRTLETRKLADADRERLQGGYDTTPRTPGLFLYNYLSNKHDNNLIDHSVSQYGVLSMWACAQMGIEIAPQYWEDVEKRWIYDQQPDGGWFYGAKASGTDHASEQASMTAAGVATLFITQDYVHQKDGLNCTGNIKNDNIDRGVKWMADHTSDWTPNYGWWAGRPVPGYTLYGVERIGVASGLKYLGSVDWYQYGADWCVKNQSKDGSWNGADNIANTALCMLFLARGRAPVLIDKIQYNNTADGGKPGPWNQRPRDVANYVRWMGEQTERDINWQISDLSVPEDELHDAPFLYFAGNQPINLKPEEVDKLRAYIQHGGMLLFNSDCGSVEGASNPFVASVSALGRAMFPDYEFRDLPDSHPIFTVEQYPQSRWKKKVVMRGLSNGVREMMILLPSDPARTWQTQQSTGAGHEEAYQSTDDLILYGIDKENFLVKGASRMITADPKITATKTAKVARLKYDRNWNPEPGGWDRLAAILHNQAKVDLTTEIVELDGKPLPKDTIAHLTGTTAFTFTTAQQQQLKNFIFDGGTLVIDAAGGSSEFAQSAEALLNKLFPGGLKDPLPAKDPLFAMGVQPLGGALDEIRYRHFAKSVLGNVRGPQLRPVRIGGRNAIYYSRYDISGGLVGEPIDGIVGYDPASSTQIMSAIILQALTKK
jgi:hypothetical protein